MQIQTYTVTRSYWHGCQIKRFITANPYAYLALNDVIGVFNHNRKITTLNLTTILFFV
jgi:hypothetical protein